MKSLSSLQLMLSATQDYLKVNELPLQMLLIYAHVAERKEMPQADLLKLTGLTQSSVSRNVAKLGAGESPREPGFGLVESFEDPYYRKRKLVRVTARGQDFAQVLEKALTRATRSGGSS